MTIFHRLIHALALSVLLGSSGAADAPPPAGLEPVPDAPTQEELGGDTLSNPDDLEPQVTIIDRNGEKIEEYRVKGALYLIKVTPKNGVAYYLIDNDGDGDLETRTDALNPRFLVPTWIIFRWK